MHFVFGNELITSAVDGIELSPQPGEVDRDVEHFWSLCEVTDSVWPLGGGVNIVVLYSAHPNLPFLFSFFLIGLSLPLLCGIPLTRSPWIKILINLSVSLPCYSWKGKEGETEEEKGLLHMGSWDDRQSTMASVCCVPLLTHFVSACLCDEPS